MEKEGKLNKKVVIVGAGMMGSGIAAIASLAGNRAILVSRSIDSARKGRQKAVDCISELVDNGLADSDNGELAKSRIETGDSLESAVQDDASMVIESIYENLEQKRQLFATLDRLLPANVPIMSNTSGIQITKIAALAERHPERTMTAHFWLPAHLTPLVEVVMWEKTNPAMAISVKEELAAWGKAPVIVRRDLPGQLANRMFQALIREAISIVETGLASPEDVDMAIKMGMGIRFPVWGPLEHIDAVGLDLCLTVQETVLPDISKEEGSEYLGTLIKQGNLGYKTGHGIYDWTKKNMDELLAKRNDFIIHTLKRLRKGNNEN